MLLDLICRALDGVARLRVRSSLLEDMGRRNILKYESAVRQQALDDAATVYG